MKSLWKEEYWSVQYKNSITNCWQHSEGREHIPTGPEACAAAEELVRATRNTYCVVHYKKVSEAAYAGQQICTISPEDITL